jgi:predicted RNA-binding protein
MVPLEQERMMPKFFGIMVYWQARLKLDNKKAVVDKGYSGKRYKDVVSTWNSHDDYYVKKFKSRALKRH